MNLADLTDLKSMIEFASEQAEKFFRRAGVVHPLYHAIKADGETLIVTPPGFSKDVDVALIKAAFALENVDRYVFMDEAWMVDDSKGQLGLDIEKARREGVQNHPHRREIVMFMAENRQGEQRTAMRFILRPEIGKPTLSPLTIDDPFDYSEGRMVGLLKRLA